MKENILKEKEKQWKKRIGAYFTVEAAVVLPVVFSVMVLVIYLLLFQYNRCLQEQDVGTLALKGCSIQTTDKDLLMEKLQSYYGAIDRDKYLAWERGEGSIVLEGGSVRVEQSGKLKFPFVELLGWNEQQEWPVVTEFENQRVSPVSFLRACRKIEN